MASSANTADAAGSVLVTLSMDDYAPIDSPFPERRITLDRENNTLPIGRASKVQSKGFVAAMDNGWFDSPVMSREHAEIVANLDTRKLEVRDVGSLHGTFLNDGTARLDKDDACELRDGDSLKFGVDIFRGQTTFAPTAVKVGVVFKDVAGDDRNHPATFKVPDGSDGSDADDYDDYSSEESQSEQDTSEPTRTMSKSLDAKNVIDLTQTQRRNHNVISEGTSGEVIDLSSPPPSPSMRSRSPISLDDDDVDSASLTGVEQNHSRLASSAVPPIPNLSSTSQPNLAAQKNTSCSDHLGTYDATTDDEDDDMDDGELFESDMESNSASDGESSDSLDSCLSSELDHMESEAESQLESEFGDSDAENDEDVSWEAEYNSEEDEDMGDAQSYVDNKPTDEFQRPCWFPEGLRPLNPGYMPSGRYVAEAPPQQQAYKEATVFNTIFKEHTAAPVNREAGPSKNFTPCKIQGLLNDKPVDNCPTQEFEKMQQQIEGMQQSTVKPDLLPYDEYPSFQVHQAAPTAITALKVSVSQNESVPLEKGNVPGPVGANSDKADYFEAREVNKVQMHNLSSSATRHGSGHSAGSFSLHTAIPQPLAAQFQFDFTSPPVPHLPRFLENLESQPLQPSTLPEETVPAQAGHPPSTQITKPRRTHVGISDIVDNCQQDSGKSKGKRKAEEISRVTNAELKWDSSTESTCESGKTEAVETMTIEKTAGPLVQKPASQAEAASAIDERPAKRQRVLIRKVAERVAYAALGGVTAGAMIVGTLIYTAPTFA